MKVTRIIFTLIFTFILSYTHAQDYITTIEGREYELYENNIYDDNYKPNIKTYIGDRITLTVNLETGKQYGKLHDKDLFIEDNRTIVRPKLREEYICELVALELPEDKVTSSGLQEECVEIPHWIVSDYEMYLIFGDNLETYNISLLNDILFAWENDFNIPVTYILGGQTIFTTAKSDPFRVDTLTEYDYVDLLQGFSNWWGANKPYQAIATLMTGKNSISSTIGIAWLNTACNSRFSTNVVGYLANNHDVVYSHEIGHNMSFLHDTIRGFIMNSFVNTASNFSPYSQDKFTSTNSTGGYDCYSCDVLDVTFLYIEAAKKNKKVFVNWGTESEENLFNFIVQSSVDGINWENVNNVRPKNRPFNYKSNFNTTLTSNIYVRIKAIDNNGEVFYSSIATTGTLGLVSVEILENQIYNEEGVDILIYNIDGKFILKSNETLININELKTGTYLVYFKGNYKKINKN